jgi:hypothetical protein
VSDDPEPLTPAELRVRSLLSELGADAAPRGVELTRDVVRAARWQRPARRLLVALGTAASAVFAGAGASFRAYRRR